MLARVSPPLAEERVKPVTALPETAPVMWGCEMLIVPVLLVKVSPPVADKLPEPVIRKSPFCAAEITLLVVIVPWLVSNGVFKLTSPLLEIVWLGSMVMAPFVPVALRVSEPVTLNPD